MKVSFRIRQVYFDKIVTGEKDNECRRASPYWEGVKEQIVQALMRHEDVVAVFERGGTGEIHQREILTIENHPDAYSALGRRPSEQGREDLGEGPVLKFILGEEVRS